MNYKQTGKVISGYYDEQLDPNQSDEVKRHLDSCHQCRGELNNLSKLTALTDDIRQEDIPVDHQQYEFFSSEHKPSKINIRSSKSSVSEPLC